MTCADDDDDRGDAEPLQAVARFGVVPRPGRSWILASHPDRGVVEKLRGPKWPAPKEPLPRPPEDLALADLDFDEDGVQWRAFKNSKGVICWKKEDC